jgi:hypothetical protein
LPLPLAPPVMLSHVALLVADHPHPSAVRTSNVPFAPPADAVADVDDSENAHPCPWFTVNVFPATVSVPERDGPLVDATVKATLPFPLPLPLDVIEIQDTLLFALQPQPDGAVTETVPEPPDEAID